VKMPTPLIDAHAAAFTAWRRDLHAHPELGFDETRTAAPVAERLESFGIEVHRGVGRTGVVGVLRLGDSPRRARSTGPCTLFECFPCDASFGLHNRPKLSVRAFADYIAAEVRKWSEAAKVAKLEPS